MKRTFVILLALLSGLLPQPSYCSEEEVLEPSEITIRAQAGAPFGEVVATVRAEGRGPERKVSRITLRVGGKSVPVPAGAYSDLVSPRLNTVELRTEAGYDKQPWLYIYLQLAFRTSDGQMRPKRVRIAYHAGRIESRSIETPNPDGSVTWKNDKL